MKVTKNAKMLALLGGRGLLQPSRAVRAGAEHTRRHHDHQDHAYARTMGTDHR